MANLPMRLTIVVKRWTGEEMVAAAPSDPLQPRFRAYWCEECKRYSVWPGADWGASHYFCSDCLEKLELAQCVDFGELEGVQREGFRMIFPAIHLNGTSRGQLLEDWCKMAHTVDEAITTLCEYAPNARDYYVHGESVWNTARAEHAERLRKLREVRAELNQIAEYVADQEGGRP